MHSNEDPGPQLRLPAERLRTPPHRRSPGLAAAGLAPVAAAATKSRVQPPSPGLSLHSPRSGHHCSSRATSLKCGTTPAPQLWGVGLSSAHAQGGTRRDLRPSQKAQTPRSAHALYSLLAYLSQSFPLGEEWGRKFELGTEVSGRKGERSDYIWATEWVNFIFEFGVGAYPPQKKKKRPLAFRAL